MAQASVPLGTVTVSERAGAVTVKLAALVPVPPGVVTVMEPVVAPAGTVAVICVPESTVKSAATPLNATPVAPAKPVPVSVTSVAIGPEAGANPLTVGATAETYAFRHTLASPTRSSGPSRSTLSTRCSSARPARWRRWRSWRRGPRRRSGSSAPGEVTFTATTKG